MATSRVTTRDNLREAETSPDGRYVRFDEKLGNGAYKDVFLSYDTETGKEVAWNAVDLRRMPNIERKRIRSETEILKSLSHPHIINFYHVWDNVEKDQICFTTEIVTSGTLKQYTSRVKCVKLKVIKKWCRQILAGLDYLHSHNPPIIHRDLKCDNIFINGSTGEIRIGDFGLSTARHKTHTESVLGTPEFMAPELYDEHYSEKVDIYAFGMCVLEMTTKEYPYEECMNAAQIWKRVSAGQKPDVLNRIKDPQVRAFLDLCLMPQHVRLSAHDLLKHPFLSFKHCDPIRDNIAVAVEERKNVCTEVDEEDDPQQRTRDLLASNAQQAAKQRKDESPDGRQIPPTINTVTSMQQPIQVINTAQPTPPTAAAAATTTTASTATTTPTPQPTTSTPVAHPSTVSTSTDMVVSHIVVEVEGTKDHIAHIVLHIHFEARRKKQIKFDFHMHEDTSDAIASEMVRALNLPEPAHTTQLIAQAIESKVEPYRQLWLTQSNAIPTTEPHDVRSQTPSPTPDNVVPTVQQHFTYETTAISTTEQYQQPTTAEGYTHPSTTVPTTAAYYPHPGTSSPHHPGRRVSYADAVNGAITPHQHVMSPHHSPASSPSQTARRLDPHHLPHPPPHAQHLPPPYEHTYDPASNPYPPHHDGTPPHHYDPHHPSYPHHSTPSPSDTGYYTPTQSQSTHDLHHTHPATHYPHYDPHHPHHIHPSHHHSTYTLPSPAPDLHTGPPSYIHASASEPHLPQPYHPPASHHDYGDPNYVYNPHEQHTYPPSHHTSSHATHTTHAAHYTPDTHFSSASSLHSEPSYPPHATPSPDPYHDPHYQHPYHMHRGTPYYPPPHTTAYTPREAHKPPTKPPSHPHHHTLPRPSSAAPLMPTYDPHHPPHHEPSSRVPHGMKRSDTSRGALPAPASQHDLDREHHDRCYEKYSKLTVAQLKELIKETGQGAQYESLDNKNDLIEAFIKLTPLCATQSTSTTSLKRSESADVLSMKSAHAALAIMTPEEHLTTRPNLSRDGSVSPPENSSPRGQYTTHTHPNGHHPYPPHTAHPPHPSLPPHGHPHPHAYPNGTYYPSTAAGTPQHYSTHDLYANGAPPPQPQTRRSDSPVQQHPHPHALPHPAAHPPPSSHPPHPHHVDSNGAYVTYPDLQSGGDMLGHVVHDGATTATSHQPSPSSQAQPPSQPSHPYPPHTQHPPHGHHLPTSTSHPQGYPPKASFPHSASTQHLAVPEYSPNTHARALSPNTYLTPSSSTSSFTSEASYDEHHPMSSPPSQHPSQPYPPRNGTYPHPYPYPHHPPPPHAYPHYPPHPQYHPHSYPSHPIHHGHSSNNLLPHQQPSPSPPAPSHQSAPYPSTHQQHTAHTHPQTQAPPPHHVPPYQPQPQPHPQSQPHPPPQSQQPPQHQAPPPTQPPPQPIHPSHPQPQPSPPPQSHSVPHPHPHPHPHPQQMPYSDVSTNMNGKTTPTLQASPKLAAASLSLPPATASNAPRRNSQLEQHSFSSHHLDTQPTTQPPSTAGHSRSNTISHDINVNDLNPDMAKKLEQAKIKEQKMMAAKEKARLEASKAEASILASFSLT